MGETGGVIVRKMHGWGNDFVVALDADQPDGPLDPAVVAASAVAVCDRRRGVGADGLIHGAVPPPQAVADGVDVVMALYNADGRRAEMSGNGIRCLAHAVAVGAGRWLDQVVIDTDVGRRTLVLQPANHAAGGAGVPAEVVAQVPMGEVTDGPVALDAAELDAVLGGLRHAVVDVGNPHLVVQVDDPAAVDLAVLGPAAEALFADGINVEVVAPGPGGLVMRVWERGVGLTEACGTGACATAVVARRWGLVGDTVSVVMPGGTAQVELDADRVTLIGPSQWVATAEVVAG